jgi:hypothetical protein
VFRDLMNVGTSNGTFAPSAQAERSTPLFVDPNCHVLPASAARDRALLAPNHIFPAISGRGPACNAPPVDSLRGKEQAADIAHAQPDADRSERISNLYSHVHLP